MSLSKPLYIGLCCASIILSLVSCGSHKEVVRDSSEASAQAALAMGIEAYKSRNYDHALIALRKVVDHKKAAVHHKIEAHKVRAFIYALQKNEKASQNEFQKAFDQDLDFTLDKAELGNPFWMPPYEAARSHVALLNASPRELTEKAVDAYLKHDYTVAMDCFTEAVKRKKMTVREKIVCYKYIAFIDALHNRPGAARQAFQKAFQLDPRFTLDKGEYGNPSWTPIYDEVLKEMKK